MTSRELDGSIYTILITYGVSQKVKYIYCFVGYFEGQAFRFGLSTLNETRSEKLIWRLFLL